MRSFITVYLRFYVNIIIAICIPAIPLVSRFQLGRGASRKFLVCNVTKNNTRSTYSPTKSILTSL